MAHRNLFSKFALTVLATATLSFLHGCGDWNTGGPGTGGTGPHFPLNPSILPTEPVYVGVTPPTPVKPELVISTQQLVAFSGTNNPDNAPNVPRPGDKFSDSNSLPPTITTPAVELTNSTPPSAPDPATTPATPGTTPATPGTTPATPGTTPATPGTTPSTPGTTPATPGTTPSTPGTTPSTPGTTPSTPGTTPGGFESEKSTVNIKLLDKSPDQQVCGSFVRKITLLQGNEFSNAITSDINIQTEIQNVSSNEAFETQYGCASYRISDSKGKFLYFDIKNCSPTDSKSIVFKPKQKALYNLDLGNLIKAGQYRIWYANRADSDGATNNDNSGNSAFCQTYVDIEVSEITNGNNSNVANNQSTTANDTTTSNNQAVSGNTTGNQTVANNKPTP